MHWIQEVKNYRNGGINHNYNYFSFYVENWWFSRLPSAAILNFSLTHRVQDLYLGQKSYLGHILPQSSTKIRGPQSVSRPFYPTTVLHRARASQNLQLKQLKEQFHPYSQAKITVLSGATSWFRKEDYIDFLWKRYPHLSACLTWGNGVKQCWCLYLFDLLS